MTVFSVDREACRSLDRDNRYRANSDRVEIGTVVVVFAGEVVVAGGVVVVVVTGLVVEVVVTGVVVTAVVVTVVVTGFVFVVTVAAVLAALLTFDVVVVIVVTAGGGVVGSADTVVTVVPVVPVVPVVYTAVRLTGCGGDRNERFEAYVGVSPSSPKLLFTPAKPGGKLMFENMSFDVVPPGVPIVSLPSMKFTGCVSVSLYTPGRSPANEQAPFVSVVVVSVIDWPRSLTPVSVTITPAIGGSPTSLLPLLFASTYTKPARLDGNGKLPKLYC